MRKISGVTLLEVLSVIAITGILIAMASVSFQTLVNKKRVSGAAEAIYADLQTARSESIRRQTFIYLSVQPGANWCYGLDDVAPCNCSVENDCQVNGITTVVSSSTYSGTSMATSGFTSGSGSTKYVQFEGIRGTANARGTVIFSNNDLSVQVSSNRMGLLDKCSDTIVNYPGC